MTRWLLTLEVLGLKRIVEINLDCLFSLEHF